MPSRLESGKEYLVESRLAPLARSAGSADVDSYIRGLRTNVAHHDAVVDALTTNETSWFRDRAPFTALKGSVLPDLIAKGRRHVKVWSAACSTGQEAYSVAITVADDFPALTLSIVGTDLSDRVVERARAGQYTQLEVNRGLPAATLVKYFQRSGPTFEIAPRLRQQVTFRKHNLLDAPPVGGPYDVVFLRNVLIYFDVATKRDVLRRVRSVLAPGGTLFLGAAETTIGIDDAWERVEAAGGSVYRLKEAKAA
ncbi:CheR family methyltransferase [Demequina litorisediminis]|uniref:Chemotaxis protein CheR n=1 Tax=Demequina litorisediminis TaxID=1849022 RepID=A0ABQ6IEN8_9MICO|nr:protein-glutamate O-methyltransferase CheR [Demequina litorisediminis]GMA35626.1 chemotaxis protein CheR [Demequina litorisediminis]